MKTRWMQSLAVSLTLVAVCAGARAEDLKIGVVLSVSGFYADSARQIQNGMALYMAQHGDTVAGRKVRLIVKDTGGIAPAVAKRVAQELLIKDKVDVLAGFALTPNAISVAPLVTQTKTPMVIMNAATASITERSPYILRTSMTVPQGAWAMAQWAYKDGIRKVYTLSADYGPGHDAEQQFTKTFTALGGHIVGSVRTPVENVDYSPYLQRVIDARPDALFMLIPTGSSLVAAVKEIKNLGLAKKHGIKILGTGDSTGEGQLPAMGDSALGLITAFHYSQAHDSPENKAYVAAYTRAYPKDRPDFMSVGGYDGMQLIYKALEKTAGDAHGDAFIAAAKGLAWTSPRGPVQIDPQTRDIIQNEYIRKTQRVNGVVQNVEFNTMKAVKDPAKSGQ
ncbi:Branched-chain amino acid transport system substrate-binding protein OS=Castellaniella defragrans OX=75697 GN=HNR28_002798 PE=3 SV=1 [Castellaniella defragrans]